MNKIWFVDKKFRAVVEKADEYSLTGFVEQVVAWDETDESGDSWKYESYLKFYLKWDGCCHINFGEANGYIHFCGDEDFNRHCKLMQELFAWSVEQIPTHMDKEK